jgi:hypothetical protein
LLEFCGSVEVEFADKGVILLRRTIEDFANEIDDCIAARAENTDDLELVRWLGCGDGGGDERY